VGGGSWLWDTQRPISLESKEEMMAEHKGNGAMTKGLKSGIVLVNRQLHGHTTCVQPLLTLFEKDLPLLAFDNFWLLSLILTCIGIRTHEHASR